MSTKQLLIISGIIAVMTGLLTPVFGQTENTEKAEFVIKAEFRSIKVVVLDDDDEHLKDLNVKNFKVWENGKQKAIVAIDEISFLEDEDKPQKKVLDEL